MRIEMTIGDKVISKSRFYNTFNYLGYEREDWRLAGSWRVGLCLLSRVCFLISGDVTNFLI